MMTTIKAVSASCLCCFALTAQAATSYGAYDPARPSVFQAAPDRLLMQAIEGRPASNLATAGIAQAKAAAMARTLTLVALVADDDKFEYGEAK